MSKKYNLLKSAGLTLGTILAVAFAPIVLIAVVIWAALYLEIKG